MSTKLRSIQVDEHTADVLEARALARGLSVAELIADLALSNEGLPPDLQGMRVEGTGPWSAAILTEDARRIDEFRRTRQSVSWDEVKAWMQTWGTANEHPPPKPREQ